MKRSMLFGTFCALFLGASVAFGSGDGHDCEGVFHQKSRLDPAEIQPDVCDAIEGIGEGTDVLMGKPALTSSPLQQRAGSCLVSGNNSHCGPLNLAGADDPAGCIKQPS